MKASCSAGDVERFRALVARRLGLWFDDAKLADLASVLDRRLHALAEDAAHYLARLDAPLRPRAELREIARELTIGETYFFRHTDQFRAFAEVALPACIQARAETKQLRLLSAACSSGEEAYSLAIMIEQRALAADWLVTIRGIDINPEVLKKARLARYSRWSLRETPEAIQERYFVAEGREYVLAKTIRNSVCFDEENLVGEEAWVPNSYDVVFCRNVLMYFTPEGTRRAIHKLSRALAPGGYLFLGHAENLRGLSQDFDLCHTHGTFYYRRKVELALAAGAFPSRLPSVRPVSRTPVPLDWTSTWLEAVQKSSDRIRALTETPRESASPPAAPTPAVVDLSLALELLAHERFGEALDVLYKLPLSSAQDADAVLLRAALLTHSGRLEAAELACTELLALDGLSAAAYYLRALCRERHGDTQAAVDHAQTASYLDPGFAMPRLHLGLMARRTGDRGTAQRELNQAALLLEREDAARLLLFGGGFQRDGLIALCHSELDRLGESA